MKISELEAAKFTDKGSTHNYLTTYDYLFEKWIGKSIDILEIGVAHGGSLLLWEAAFPGSNIVGLDINLSNIRHAFGEKTKVIQVNAADTKDMEQKIADSRFDLVVEDGSHHLSHQVTAVKYFATKIKSGGMIVVEDVQSDDDMFALLAIGKIIANVIDCKVLDLRSTKGRYDDILVVYQF